MLCHAASDRPGSCGGWEDGEIPRRSPRSQQIRASPQTQVRQSQRRAAPKHGFSARANGFDARQARAASRYEEESAVDSKLIADGRMKRFCDTRGPSGGRAMGTTPKSPGSRRPEASTR